MNKQRIKELDVLRVIGFIFVVAQHVVGAYAWREGAAYSDSLILSFLYNFAKPAVPLFITVTAVSLCSAYLGKMNVLKFYKNRFLYIFLPYVSWTIINIYDAQHDGTGSYNNFLGQLLAGTGRYHLWYMSLILQIYLLFPLVLWIARQMIKRGKPLQVGFLITFFVFYVILLKNNEIMDTIASFIFGSPTTNQQRFLERNPLLWSIYFVMGMYIFVGNEGFKFWIRRFQKQIFFLYALSLAYMYYAEIWPHLPRHIDIGSGYLNCFLYVSFMVLSIIIFYRLGCYIADEMPRVYFFLQRIAVNTYSGYLAHVIILQAVAEEIIRIYHIKSFLLSGLIIFSLTVVLSLIIAETCSLFPFSQVLLGSKNKYYPSFDEIVKRFTMPNRQITGEKAEAR
ncbi:MAG: hypothetical protein AWM53_00975 [Candidatus Dichloromethanomonas elyunquensis]|nr:MAG: hypothetical protein AWM53_00975 [Candidatus Dichloromethanomonas elyunquensis]